MLASWHREGLTPAGPQFSAAMPPETLSWVSETEASSCLAAPSDQISTADSQ